MRDPATDEVIATVADAQPHDGLDALDEAVSAGDAWAATPPRERGEILRRAFELMVEGTDELAATITAEMGKPLSDSKAEVAYAAEFFRWFSEEAVRIDGGYSTSPASGNRIITLRQPVGPCLLITPWNFPIAMAARKVGPALAAGCTVVCKPAALTPLSMLALAALLDEAGVPPGVVNVVPTSDAGALSEPIIADPRLRKLSFTGSTAVGRDLMAQAAQGMLRVSFELGGNAPFLVFEDADLDEAVEGAMVAKMRNVGQACTAANRFFVHGSLSGQFAERLAERMAAMKVGPGAEPGSEVGPLVSRRQRDKVAELVSDAVASGAEIVTGGDVIEGPGWFYEPTVLVDPGPEARLLTEEVFGPVAPIISFDSDEEAIAAANDTDYGLAAYLFTRSLDRAVVVAEALEVGMVGINQGLVSNPAAPFGGVKASGLGREGGHEGIAEYLETKYLALRLPRPRPIDPLQPFLPIEPAEWRGPSERGGL